MTGRRKARPRLVEDAIRVIKRWGAVSAELLSRELGVPPPVSKRLIEYLKEEGYLVEVECTGACGRCPLRGLCAPPLRVYRLAGEERRQSGL